MEIEISSRVVLVDEEDVSLIRSRKWKVEKNGYVTHRYKRSGKRYVELLHRLILDAAEGQFVDHVNGNPRDNRRENLRICTHAQNMKNRKKGKNNSSGYKGVYAGKGKGRWRAEIKSDGKRYGLGTYASPEEASEAYKRAAKRLHGQFARFG